MLADEGLDTLDDLADDIKDEKFREDLYHRLSVILIHVPSLNERLEDIPLLAAHLLERACETMNRPHVRMTDATLVEMQAYDWPGNVRELENTLERVIADLEDEYELRFVFVDDGSVDDHWGVPRVRVETGSGEMVLLATNSPVQVTGPIPPGSWLHRGVLLAIGYGYFGFAWTRTGQTLGMKSWRIRVRTRFCSRCSRRKASWC